MRIIIDVPLPISIHSSKLTAVRDGLVLIMQNCDEDTRLDPNFWLNKIIKEVAGGFTLAVNDEEQQRAEEKEIKDRLRHLQAGMLSDEEEGRG